MNRNLLLAVIALVFSFSGCKKDSNDKLQGTYSKGVFIVNEGSSSVSSSLSYFNPDSAKVYNDIFFTANQLPLGLYTQSINIANSNYYVIVGGSNKVEVVNQTDFKLVKTIWGFATPRYFLTVNSKKAYVSQWGESGVDGTIIVINLTSNTMEDTIKNVGSGTDKMLKFNNKIYAVNAGGWGNDSTITVIDPLTDAIVKRITVGYNPNSLVVDKSGRIWVLCSGKSENWSIVKPGALVSINPSTFTVEKSMTYTEMKSPSSLTINAAKDQLVYIYNGGVYQQDINASTLNTTAKINRSFYHIGIDPSNNILYATDPKKFTSNGILIRYNNSFAKIDSCTVSVGPGELFFNN